MVRQVASPTLPRTSQSSQSFAAFPSGPSTKVTRTPLKSMDEPQATSSSSQPSKKGKEKSKGGSEFAVKVVVKSKARPRSSVHASTAGRTPAMRRQSGTAKTLNDLEDVDPDADTDIEDTGLKTPPDSQADPLPLAGSQRSARARLAVASASMIYPPTPPATQSLSSIPSQLTPLRPSQRRRSAPLGSPALPSPNPRARKTQRLSSSASTRRVPPATAPRPARPPPQAHAARRISSSQPTRKRRQSTPAQSGLSKSTSARAIENFGSRKGDDGFLIRILDRPISPPDSPGDDPMLLGPGPMRPKVANSSTEDNLDSNLMDVAMPPSSIRSTHSRSIAKSRSPSMLHDQAPPSNMSSMGSPGWSLPVPSPRLGPIARSRASRSVSFAPEETLMTPTRPPPSSYDLGDFAADGFNSDSGDEHDVGGADDTFVHMRSMPDESRGVDFGDEMLMDQGMETFEDVWEDVEDAQPLEPSPEKRVAVDCQQVEEEGGLLEEITEKDLPVEQASTWSLSLSERQVAVEDGQDEEMGLLEKRDTVHEAELSKDQAPSSSLGARKDTMEPDAAPERATDAPEDRMAVFRQRQRTVTPFDLLHSPTHDLYHSPPVQLSSSPAGPSGSPVQLDKLVSLSLSGSPIGSKQEVHESPWQHESLFLERGHLSSSPQALAREVSPDLGTTSIEQDEDLDMVVEPEDDQGHGVCQHRERLASVESAQSEVQGIDDAETESEKESEGDDGNEVSSGVEEQVNTGVMTAASEIEVLEAHHEDAESTAESDDSDEAELPPRPDHFVQQALARYARASSCVLTATRASPFSIRPDTRHGSAAPASVAQQSPQPAEASFSRHAPPAQAADEIFESTTPPYSPIWLLSQHLDYAHSPVNDVPRERLPSEAPQQEPKKDEEDVNDGDDGQNESHDAGGDDEGQDENNEESGDEGEGDVTAEANPADWEDDLEEGQDQRGLSVTPEEEQQRQLCDPGQPRDQMGLGLEGEGPGAARSERIVVRLVQRTIKLETPEPEQGDASDHSEVDIAVPAAVTVLATPAVEATPLTESTTPQRTPPVRETSLSKANSKHSEPPVFRFTHGSGGTSALEGALRRRSMASSASVSDSRMTPAHLNSVAPPLPPMSRPRSLFEELMGAEEQVDDDYEEDEEDEALLDSVVEVSSLNPKAAARAAAILKMNHDYIEHGVMPPDGLRSYSGHSQRSIKVDGANVTDAGDMTRDELLQEAELDILDHRRRSRSASRALSMATRTDASDDEDLRLPGSFVFTPGRKRKVKTPRPARQNSIPPLIEDRSWGVPEWKRLERCYREERTAWTGERTIKKAGQPSHGGLMAWARKSQAVPQAIPWDDDRVIQRFILESKVVPAQLKGEWERSVLRLRVQALTRRLSPSAGPVLASTPHKRPRTSAPSLVPATPARPLGVSQIQAAPPSTVKRMLGFVFGGLSGSQRRHMRPNSPPPPSKPSKSIQGSEKAVSPIGRQSSASSTSNLPIMKEVSRGGATMAESTSSMTTSSIYPSLTSSISQRSSAIQALFAPESSHPPSRSIPIPTQRSNSALSSSTLGRSQSVKDLVRSFESQDDLSLNLHRVDSRASTSSKR